MYLFFLPILIADLKYLQTFPVPDRRAGWPVGDTGDLKNFKRLVSETVEVYRHEAKTRNRYHLGASFEGLIIRIKKELEAPRRKNIFLVKFGFSVKIHLYHPKGGLHC